MLTESEAQAVRGYFTTHPVLGRYLDRISICLTGSHAFGLGGRGADLDLKVLAPPAECQEIRAALLADGRITPGAAPEEELTGLVGDYALESLDEVWGAVQGYQDLTQVFIYGHLIPVLGRTDLVENLVAHCRSLPSGVAEEARRREEGRLSEALYAFLRSFQTGDVAGRLLARAGLIRAAMRQAFLADAQAPPYDKHLFRLLTGTTRGGLVGEAVRMFLRAGEGAEAEQYSLVAGSSDWHEMYLNAEGTPVMEFRNSIQSAT